MKKSTFSEQQITFILRRVNGGEIGGDSIDNRNEVEWESCPSGGSVSSSRINYAAAWNSVCR